MYIKVRTAHLGLIRLNEAFLKYAAALNQIASASYLTEDDVNTISSDINRTGTEALNMLSMGRQDIPTEVISLTVAAVSQAYIQSKQRDAVEKIVKSNQVAVEEYCSLARALINDFIGKVRQRSSNSLRDLDDKLDAEETFTRADVINALDLFDETVNKIEFLVSMYNVYNTLPEAHRNLLDASDTGSVAAIENLVAFAKRMHTQYKALKDESAAQNQ